MPDLSFRDKTKRCTNLRLNFCTKMVYFYLVLILPNTNVTPNEMAALTTCLEEPGWRSLRSAKAPGCLHGHGQTTDTEHLLATGLQNQRVGLRISRSN